MLRLVRDSFPIDHVTDHRDIKDPCLVEGPDGWHIFGSGGSVLDETWGVCHLTAPTLDGPWEGPHLILNLPGSAVEGSGVAAPGVIWDGTMFQMFIQTEFQKTGGRIVYLTSVDGDTWINAGSALESIPGSPEAGIYDPHPTQIGDECYLIYSGFSEGGVRPDLFLARSTGNTWLGPWERLGCIVRHEEIAFHNPRDHHDYEWGLEGAQLTQLPDGRILLVGVCFLAWGARGHRQRIFTAVADDPRGPFREFAMPMAHQPDGENGHATVVAKDSGVLLCYQKRCAATDGLWRYGLSHMELAA